MWHALRTPWTIVSGAEEGGIYKSTDAGEHWTKLGGGLPAGLFGRSNVAVTNASPDRLYALIEAKPGEGLYRSDDAGATWALVNHSTEISTRPFYYTTIDADPSNADVIWLGDETWFKSGDAGKTFKRMPIPHGDNHDLWINPRDSRYMIQGDDGGATVSIDGGKTWTPEDNQATAELYQVYVDNQYPYRVYGAQQDNTTVIVPTLPLGDGQDFREGPGCETGPIIPDTTDPKIVYGGCKGQWTRLNTSTRDEQRYWIGAQSLYGNAGSDEIYRFQRVAPMEVSPTTPHVEYYGSQYLHRTRDDGVTWERISPDLTAHPAGTQGASGQPITRDATGEEIYSVIYAIKESALEKGVIWTGSNDGLVYVTRDDGKNWTNVTPAGLPPGGRVQNIDISPHQAGTAYVAIYRFLNGGDFAPYLYRTNDYGKSWKRLTDGTNGIPKDTPTRVVRADPDRAGLLYAGTEFGLYVSFDDGGHWQPFQLNLPVTPVTDIKVTHKDLQVATQGRSFYILDDITPLHEITAETASGPMLYTPKEAVRTPSGESEGGDAIMRFPPSPVYPKAGALLDYYLPAGSSAEVTLEILDSAGKRVRSFSSIPPAPAQDAGGADAGRRGPGRKAHQAGRARENSRYASLHLGSQVSRALDKRGNARRAKRADGGSGYVHGEADGWVLHRDQAVHRHRRSAHHRRWRHDSRPAATVRADDEGSRPGKRGEQKRSQDPRGAHEADGRPRKAGEAERDCDPCDYARDPVQQAGTADACRLSLQPDQCDRPENRPRRLRAVRCVADRAGAAQRRINEPAGSGTVCRSWRSWVSGRCDRESG